MTARAYIDTSLLVKRYVPERGSDELDHYLEETQPELFVSELTRLELVSALGRKCRQGEFTQRHFIAVQQQADQDFIGGAIEVLQFDSLVIRHALDLMRSLTQPVATLDAIHLSTALQAQVQLFMTDDLQLARAAMESGLRTWPALPGKLPLRKKQDA